MLTVVKVGGALVTDAHAMEELADAIAALPGRVIVVHGGGPEISEWQQRAGIPVEWSDGLRITTEAGMQVASMVLSGWTNKRLVSALNQAGVHSVGLSGEDGTLVVAFRKQGGALGEVGTVAAVQPAVLDALLGAGFVPVISPVSTGPGGAPLNVNADEVASAVASALQADRLLLVSEAPGVVRDGTVLDVLHPGMAEELIESGVATGGMIVKLRSAVDAAHAGVRVCIGGPGIVSSRGGTQVATTIPVTLGAA